MATGYGAYRCEARRLTDPRKLKKASRVVRDASLYSTNPKSYNSNISLTVSPFCIITSKLSLLVYKVLLFCFIWIFWPSQAFYNKIIGDCGRNGVFVRLVCGPFCRCRCIHYSADPFRMGYSFRR